MKHLPDWMHLDITPDDWHRSPLSNESKRRRSAVRGAASGFARLIASVLTDDETAAHAGLLQSIDARAKVLGLVGLIVVVTLIHNLPALLTGYLFCIILAVLSKVPFRRFACAWLVVPFFSAMLMIPATLNIVTDGRHILTIWQNMNFSIGPWQLPTVLAVTDAGLLIAAKFILRTAVCVSLTVLLASTTRPSRLFRGLRMLGVPQIFVVLLTMMERYLGLLIRTAEEIHLAKISRSITVGTLHQEQAWVAAGMGTLFRRTHILGNAVYLAMISRGYTGEIYLLKESRWCTRDWMFLTASAVAGAVLILLKFVN